MVTGTGLDTVRDIMQGEEFVLLYTKDDHSSEKARRENSKMAKISESLGVNEDADINAGKHGYGWLGGLKKNMKKANSTMKNFGTDALDVMGDMVS